MSQIVNSCPGRPVLFTTDFFATQCVSVRIGNRPQSKGYRIGNRPQSKGYRIGNRPQSKGYISRETGNCWDPLLDWLFAKLPVIYNQVSSEPVCCVDFTAS